MSGLILKVKDTTYHIMDVVVSYRPLFLKQGSKPGMLDTSDQEKVSAATQAGTSWGLVPAPWALVLQLFLQYAHCNHEWERTREESLMGEVRGMPPFEVFPFI